MNKRNFYTIILVALAALSITALYYLSKKSTCCGSMCHASAEQMDHSAEPAMPMAESETVQQ